MDERRRLPDAELEVMQALWSQTQYPVTTAELLPRLAEHRWQTATLLKLLSRLEDRGFLVRREEYLAAESRSFLERLHGGSLPSLVASLMESRSLSEQEVAELEAILKGGEPHA